MTTEAARVSIIVTSYNQRDHLIEAIESALSQTVRPFEIIVADDHSTRDDSAAVIADYAVRYPDCVKAVYQLENVGIPANRNSALALVQGDWVCILDGDDRLLPAFLQEHLKALAAHPGAGCSYSNLYYIGLDGARSSIRDGLVLPSGSVLADLVAFRPGLMRSMLMRTDLVRAAGALDVRHAHFDGYVLTLRLAAITQFVYVLQPLVEKRIDPKSVSSRAGLVERAAALRAASDEAFKFTGQLTDAEARQARETWYWVLLEADLAVDLEAGRRWRVLRRLAAGLFGRPCRARSYWRLASKLWRGLGYS